MAEKTLHTERTADGGSRTVWLSRLPQGGVSVNGQDLGDLSRFFGPGVREYEWAYSVAVGDVPALVRALGGAADADPIELLAVRFAGVQHREFSNFCAAEGIPVDFWSRFGE